MRLIDADSITLYGYGDNFPMGCLNMLLRREVIPENSITPVNLMDKTLLRLNSYIMINDIKSMNYDLVIDNDDGTGLIVFDIYNKFGKSYKYGFF